MKSEKNILKIVLAQVEFQVGTIQRNCETILLTVQQAIELHDADIVVFPELTLTGYPPEDLLLRKDFLTDAAQALSYIQSHLPDHVITIIGYPEYQDNVTYNSAAVLMRNSCIAHHRKQLLPNYGIFDEKRYFHTGNTACVFHYKNIAIGLTICEDLWQPETAQQAKAAGAQLLISLNASPFNVHKIEFRQKIMRQRVAETHLPLLYVNHCYGQDDLVFDGSSFVLDQQGKIIAQAPFCETALLPITINTADLTLTSSVHHEAPKQEAQLYQALVLGVRDYVRKNHFTKVLLGFSGGIDSALTLAIAVDALGKENVLPVLLPSRYTSQLSLQAAYAQLTAMDLAYQEISIEPSFNALLTSLTIDARQPPNTITTQNLQARCRGIILMALSNDTNALLLNTTNKSELAVGYGTLYGDMCGGYAVLKDVWKTWVYQLANYRNRINPIIPQEIIDRPPSAELAPDQLDTDALPPYDLLDPLLQRYVEQQESIATLIEAGFPENTIKQVIRLVKLNEHKRRQAPPGPRVTTYAFGRERRFPITSGY